MRRPIQLLALLALVLVLFGIGLNRPTDTPEVATPLPAARTLSPSDLEAHVAASAADMAPQRQPNPHPLTPFALQQAQRSTPSLRAFVHFALQHAEAGGFISAWGALDECFGETLDGAGLPESSLSPKSEQSLQADALLRAACDLDPGERERVMQLAIGGPRQVLSKDPNLQVLGRSIATGYNQTIGLGQARDLIRLGNPYASFSLLSLGSTPEQPDLHFAGQFYSSPFEQRLLTDAWLLLTCDMGQNCGPEAVPTLRMCRDRGWCAQSLQSAMALGYERIPDGLPRLRILHQRLLRAWREQSAESFAPGSPGAAASQASVSTTH
ncbi:hypothetical protein HNQ51_002153 [Inhella inkyongensis]|uniref:Uncharacterized protein n=1 Tax=Inhella inkyongensis TaxID=392593 RepID=A0A840S8U8_9BURK|nr:hypothetical protein [Inhella inkyongensis]MBB5204839.1 hypothetical protein [Inhella inkyongensis]